MWKQNAYVVKQALYIDRLVMSGQAFFFERSLQYKRARRSKILPGDSMCDTAFF
jgi:hypothetical protein